MPQKSKTADMDIVFRLARRMYCYDMDLMKAVDYLGIGRNAIQRALEKRGTTFMTLHSEVKKRKGVKYTAKGMNIADLADELGYSRITNFKRFWRGMTGENYDDYRKREFPALKVAK